MLLNNTVTVILLFLFGHWSVQSKEIEQQTIEINAFIESDSNKQIGRPEYAISKIYCTNIPRTCPLS